MKRTTSHEGQTLLELSISITVFVVGLGGLYLTLDQAGNHARHSQEWLVAQQDSRRPLTWLTDLVSETSFSHVDTTMRFAYGGLGASSQYESDRFSFSGMRQCPSATCSFHTKLDLNVERDQFLCAHEFRQGALSPVTRGKVWASDVSACEYDGAQTLGSARLDVLKMFLARNAAGDFTSLPDGTPRWNSLVLVAPSIADDGTCSLVRYDIFVEDLVAQGLQYSLTWQRWNPQSPDMAELFDFGTDGTRDGIPDGNVPTTAAETDADWEYFATLTSSDTGNDVLYIRKQLTAGTVHRDLMITVDLDDGTVSFDIEHYENASTYWKVVGQFRRPGRVVATNLTEFSASTSLSNPHDDVNNPTGVAERGVVRVALGTSRAVNQNGVVRRVHNIDVYSVRPRN